MGVVPESPLHIDHIVEVVFDESRANNHVGLKRCPQAKCGVRICCHYIYYSESI